MFDAIRTITSVIADELERFSKEFDNAIYVKDDLLNRILKNLFETKGKRIRPVLTILTAKALGEVTDMTYRGAVIVELLHNASLLHDDVVDFSVLRRQRPTANAIFGNKLAVLAGDYLYGKALATIKTEKDFSLMDVFSDIAISLPKGEILEIDNTNNKSLLLDDYLRVIYYKTASLIKASCQIGQRSLGSVEYEQEVKDLGKNLGLAFQIKDDLLDYDINNQTGKGVGNDIKECKITLPIIYLLSYLQGEQKDNMIRLFFNQNKTDEDVNYILHKVNTSKALQDAELMQNEYSKRAFEIANELPKNEYSKALCLMVRYLTERKR